MPNLDFLPSRSKCRATPLRKGFSLVEIMVAMTIGVVVMAMVLVFAVDNLKMNFVTEQKNNINNDIRQLTGLIAKDGRQANDFFIYPSYSDTDAKVGSSGAGDFLLLIYNEWGDVTLENGVPTIRDSLTVKLVGYYRETSTTTGAGALKRFEIDVPEADQTSTDYTALLSLTSPATHRVVVDLSQGLAQDSASAPRLFFNYNNRSVMVNGMILHGNEAKRVTDTYNFTISPRG